MCYTSAFSFELEEVVVIFGFLLRRLLVGHSVGYIGGNDLTIGHRPKYGNFTRVGIVSVSGGYAGCPAAACPTFGACALSVATLAFDEDT